MSGSRVTNRLLGVPRGAIELNRSLQLLASLRRLGWHQTLGRGAPVDAAGEPLPWYTYPCIEWLEQRLRASDAIFEFGAGSSTLWYGRRVRRVVAVDHDPGWFRRLAPLVPANVDLRLRASLDDGAGGLQRSPSDYLAAIEEFPQGCFDVVAVDGMERVGCAMAARRHLKPDGLLLFDNSDRPDYRRAIDGLRDQGAKRIDFCGFYPGAGVPGCTSVFSWSFDRWLCGDAVITSWGL